MKFLIGEALVGKGFEVAHVDLMIGTKEGPIGYAFANALSQLSAGHTPLLAVLRPNLITKPPAVIVPKVTVKDLNQAELIFGPAQYAVAKAISDAVEEGIMLTEDGYVAEATVDNIFVVKSGRITTPPVYLGILDGITRRTVIEIIKKEDIPFRESPLTISDLYTADEIFVTGTAAELMPIVEVDSRKVGNGKPGPLFNKLREEFRKITENEGEPID